jgi:hypothetical protein
VLYSHESSVTAEIIERHRSLVRDATTVLESHLQYILNASSSDRTEMQLIKEEQKSARIRLQICAQLSDHINQLESTSKRSGSASGDTDADNESEKSTMERLKTSRTTFMHNSDKLRDLMKRQIDRLMMEMITEPLSVADRELLKGLVDGVELVHQQKDIFNEHCIHFSENVTTFDHYSLGDGTLLTASTGRRAVHGKNRGLGWKSRHGGGDMSDVSLQAMSQNLSNPFIRSPEDEEASSRDGTPLIPEVVSNSKAGKGLKYFHRDGQILGHSRNLDTTSSAEVKATSSSKR